MHSSFSSFVSCVHTASKWRETHSHWISILIIFTHPSFLHIVFLFVLSYNVISYRLRRCIEKTKHSCFSCSLLLQYSKNHHVRISAKLLKMHARYLQVRYLQVKGRIMRNNTLVSARVNQALDVLKLAVEWGNEVSWSQSNSSLITVWRVSL